MKRFLFMIMLFIPSIIFAQQWYFTGAAGFNSLGFKDGGHDMIANFNTGCKLDSAFRVQLDFGYNPSETVMGRHLSDQPIINASALGISFGPSFYWSPIGTFTNDRSWKWFDFYIFAKTGMNYYKFSSTDRFYGAYLGAGIEVDFTVRNLTFLIQADFTGKTNAGVRQAYKEGSTTSPNYSTQNILFGVRYNIDLPKRQPRQIINNVDIPCCESNKTTEIFIVHDTVTISTEKPIVEYIHDTIVRRDTIVVEKEVAIENLTTQNILFANDKYEIRETEKYKLELVLETLNKYPELKVELIGMASKTGSESHNKWLSQQRCESVKNWLLIRGGFQFNRIITNPIGDGKSDENDIDRCVVIKYVK